jgi:hypothetical protein
MSSVGCVEVEETLPHLGVAVSLPSLRREGVHSVGCVEVEETLPHLGVAVSLPSPNHGVRGHVDHARATVGATRHRTAKAKNGEGRE